MVIECHILLIKSNLSGEKKIVYQKYILWASTWWCKCSVYFTWLFGQCEKYICLLANIYY